MMKYFYSITDLEQAKLRYRTLAKQLHPDKGGDAVEFQKMQEEYNSLLLKIQQPHNKNTIIRGQTPEKELLNELGKLAKVLIKKQVPQNYLKQKIKTTESPLKKGLFNDIVNFLDGL
jgi:hypothetical protein